MPTANEPMTALEGTVREQLAAIADMQAAIAELHRASVPSALAALAEGQASMAAAIREDGTFTIAGVAADSLLTKTHYSCHVSLVLRTYSCQQSHHVRTIPK